MQQNQNDYLQRKIDQAAAILGQLLLAKKGKNIQDATRVFSSFWVSTFDHAFGTQDLEYELQAILKWSEGNKQCLQELFSILHETASEIQEDNKKIYALKLAEKILRHLTETSDTYDFQQHLMLRKLSNEIAAFDNS